MNDYELADAWEQRADNLAAMYGNRAFQDTARVYRTCARELRASAPAATQGEAVAWQYRINSGGAQGWSHWAIAEKSAIDANLNLASSIFEVRALGVIPTPQATASCRTCNGHGVIGGHAKDGSFDGQDCPDCPMPAGVLCACGSSDPKHKIGRNCGRVQAPQPTAPARAAEATQPAAAPGYKLVPMIPTPAMNRVMDSEGWAWEDLLAAACAITEDEYEQIAGSGTFQPAPPAAAEQRDAQRYRKMRAWFVAEGRRSDITPNGHICIITAADVDAGVDALPPSQAPAGVEPPYTDYRAQYWKDGRDGKEIDATTRGGALAAWAEGRRVFEALAGVEAAQQGQAAPGAMEAAARWVEARRDAYVQEHGSYDPETGGTDFPGDGAEYVGELDEIAEGLRALAPLPEPQVDDLAALVARLVRSLRQAAPDNDLPAKAMDYLKRHGLQGSPLRAATSAKSHPQEGHSDASR